MDGITHSMAGHLPRRGPVASGASRRILAAGRRLCYNFAAAAAAYAGVCGSVCFFSKIEQWLMVVSHPWIFL